MIAIFFGSYLSFTTSSMLCVHGLRVIHNQHFEPFEFCDLQYIQYNKFLETAPPPPFSKDLDDRAPTLSQGLDPAVVITL